MSQRNPWDEVAQTYDEARPSYPNELIDDLVDGACLSSESRLLEIGAGTGKATLQLAERGFRIHCVEPGRNLAAILEGKCSHFPNVSVDVATFEEWKPRENAQYDLILCAQAFNWLNPNVRYRKCHQLLSEDGYLALFWYKPLGDSPHMANETTSWESDIVASELFQEPQVFEYVQESVVSTEMHIKVMQSHSQFALLDDDAKFRMIDEARRDADRQGGMLSSKLNYTMYLTKRNSTLNT